MRLERDLVRCCLLIFFLFIFKVDISVAKSSKCDGGVINLLKVHFERLLEKIIKYTVAEENRELGKMNQLLLYYYKYNKTNISELQKVSPLEDIEMFDGTLRTLSITEISKAIHRNRRNRYRIDWHSQRRNNVSKENIAYLKRGLRKLPHVNKTLACLVLDEIGHVTVPTHKFHRLCETEGTPRRTRRRTQPKHYLRYVSYVRPKTEKTESTTVHMCELC